MPDFDTAGALLKSANRVVVVSHVRPDGDAVGSTLGLGLTLKAAGKQVYMALIDGVPSNFRHLTGSDTIVQQIPTEAFKPGWLVVTLDASDLQRTGGIITGRLPDLNIDHHITNMKFATCNLVDPEAVATSAILAQYLPQWGFKIPLPAAEAMLTGIITDTIGFRTSNMNATALRVAADLVDIGANLPDLYMRGLIRKSYEALRYWGCSLNKLHHEDGLVWSTLTLKDRRAVGYPGNDDADLVNLLSSIDTAQVTVLFIEQKQGTVKVSWRAKLGFDVAQIAVKFGGGGHAPAAGADIPGRLEDVQQQVLAATRRLLDPTPANRTGN